MGLAFLVQLHEGYRKKFELHSEQTRGIGSLDSLCGPVVVALTWLSGSSGF